MSQSVATSEPHRARPGDESLADLLAAAAAAAPDAPFVEDAAGARHTVGSAAALVSRARQRLAEAGLEPGDRVGICLPNDVRWPLTWLTVVGAGLVAVPVNRAYEAGDVRHLLDDADVAAVVTDPDLAPKIKGAGARRAPVVLPASELLTELPDGSDDPVASSTPIDGATLANLQYTSGTSGMPKACMLPHSYWIEVGRAMGDAFRLGPEDRLVTAQPFSYIDPMWMVTMSLLHRVPLTILPRFSVSTFWSDVRACRATVLYVLGSMPQLLLSRDPADDDRDNDVRLVLCSAIPEAVHDQLERRWDAPWREAYGLTESGLNILAPLDDPRSVGQGLLGVPAPGWSARVVDTTGADLPPGSTGELVVTGPSLMTGYWGRPDATAEVLRDGWFHTGDLATMREDGWFRLVGRLKDSIRRGGENIAASEVEEIIREMPEVNDCAVVGVPDDLFGEEVKVHVEVLEGGTTDPDGLAQLAERVREHARTRLAPFKVPRYVEAWRSLPRTPSERIAKHRIGADGTEPPLVSVDLGQRGGRQ